MNPQTQNILRWIAVLPAALLGAVITPLIMWMLTSRMTAEIELGSFWSKFWAASGVFGMGIGFIYFGTFTAPSRKEIVVCVLAALGLLFCGAAILLSFRVEGLIVYALSATAGVGTGFYTTLKHFQEEDTATHEDAQ